MSFIQFPSGQLTPIFIKMGISSTVTLIIGKILTVKYMHLSVLM